MAQKSKTEKPGEPELLILGKGKMVVWDKGKLVEHPLVPPAKLLKHVLEAADETRRWIQLLRIEGQVGAAPDGPASWAGRAALSEARRAAAKLVRAMRREFGDMHDPRRCIVQHMNLSVEQNVVGHCLFAAAEAIADWLAPLDDPGNGPMPELPQALYGRFMFASEKLLEIVDEVRPDGTHGPDKTSDDLVDTKEVAKLLHLSPDSVRKYRKDWPAPDVQGKGRAPNKWSYARLRPTLAKQFPDHDLPQRLSARD